MNRLRSIVVSAASWLIAGALLYLVALRLATAAPWPVRGLAYLVLLAVPFTFLQRALAANGIGLDLAWIALPIMAAALIPFDSAPRK